MLQDIFCNQCNGESSYFNPSEREGFGCGSCPICSDYNWQKGKKFTLFHEVGHVASIEGSRCIMTGIIKIQNKKTLLFSFTIKLIGA
jgi:hypothetical protein